MRFANPDYLWFLTLLPAVGAYLFFFREHDLPGFRFPSFNLLKGSIEKTPIKSVIWSPGILRTIALTFLILALARPQKGIRSEEMTTKATDIMICLDVSRSMLTIDFKPENRIEVAKRVIKDFIKGRDYDRLGLVVFAESAMTLCPLTLDKSALLNIIDQIKIYSIGAGSTEGGLMPIDDPNLGTQYVQVKSDLDEDMLLKIAESTGGKYFRAKNSEALKTIFQEIDQLEKTDIKTKEYVDYEERYFWFLLLAVVCLFSELTLHKTFLRTLP